jgi:very-short-patch-repair endonuclease
VEVRLAFDADKDAMWTRNRVIQEAALRLRGRATRAEVTLWESLRGNRLDGLHFRRQHPIDRFVLDFYCPARKSE